MNTYLVCALLNQYCVTFFYINIHSVVDEVKGKVWNFSKRFNKMVSKVSDALEKENVPPKKVVNFLKMPDPYYKTRKEHMTFVKTLEETADILTLLGALNEYWDHFNYHLLEQLIMAPGIKKCIGKKKCCQLKRSMREYIQDMDEFRPRATIGDYCKEFVKEEEAVPEDFKKLVSKHVWPEVVTLQDVEDFRQKVAQDYQLQKCLVFFKNIRFGSVILTWWIPMEALPCTTCSPMGEWIVKPSFLLFEMSV